MAVLCAATMIDAAPPPGIVEQAFDVDAMVRQVMLTEGGYVAHPSDRGGITNHGISLRFAMTIGLDRNGDGVTDEEDILDLSIEEAVFLYKNYFYYGPRINELRKDLRPQIFDIAVHAGGGRAIKILQTALNKKLDSMWPRLAVDGILGPRTRRATTWLIKDLGVKQVNNIIVTTRMEFYESLVRLDPSQQVFMRGWTIRAMKYLQP